ncbi:MAG: hypothetical protein GY953_48940, partial [bacterium]|nr:hypothetical protein [bacterium]
GAPRRLTTDSAVDATPSWSPDRNWIYFRSTRSGENQVWRLPARGGDAMRVTQNGGRLALASPDGRFLFYANRGGLWRVPAEGGAESPIIDSIGGFGLFAVADQGIYFVSAPEADGGYTLRFHESASGAVRDIASMPAGLFYSLSISPDERYALFGLTEQADSDLMLVENFR